MKTILALAVLSVISSNSDSWVITNIGRANLDVGNITSADRILFTSYERRVGIAEAIVSTQVLYRGNATTRIAAIQAYEVGPTQFANASIGSGGIGESSVVVHFSSIIGRGFYYHLTIWGH